jgi:hypothetical protein
VEKVCFYLLFLVFTRLTIIFIFFYRFINPYDPVQRSDRVRKKLRIPYFNRDKRGQSEEDILSELQLEISSDQKATPPKLIGSSFLTDGFALCIVLHSANVDCPPGTDVLHKAGYQMNKAYQSLSSILDRGVGVYHLTSLVNDNNAATAVRQRKENKAILEKRKVCIFSIEYQCYCFCILTYYFYR